MVADLTNVGIEFININSYIKNAELYSSAYFSEEILYKSMIQININYNIFKLPKLRLKRLRYKIMSKITFGKTKNKYKEKAKKFKIRIKKAQEFIGK